MTPDELQEYLGKKHTDGVLASEVSYGDLRLTLDADAYVAVAELCRSDERLALDFFDCLFGVDARDDGFDVITVLYSVKHRHRVILKHRCAGGRENPVAPTLTHLWRGADWHEREAWDMYGIEFDGHPGLAPRILCAENFEGWPLRKDFFLASRVAKSWPGVKEPAETDEDGNVIEKVQLIGDAPGPTVLDELMAEHAKKANPRPTGAGEPDAPEVEAGADAPDDAGEAPAAGDDTSGADRAERARKLAAEARARKAAERAAEADAPADAPPAAAPPAEADDAAAPQAVEPDAPAAPQAVEPAATPDAAVESTGDDDEEDGQ